MPSIRPSPCWGKDSDHLCFSLRNTGSEGFTDNPVPPWLVFSRSWVHTLRLLYLGWTPSHCRVGVPAPSLAAAAAAAKSLQSCPTLCDPRDGSPPGSPVPGILQARTLEWVAISFSNAWKWKVKVKSLSHVRLSDPMDSSLPGSSIHGIFQARVLEWGAIAFSTIIS